MPRQTATDLQHHVLYAACDSCLLRTSADKGTASVPGLWIMVGSIEVKLAYDVRIAEHQGKPPVLIGPNEP